MNACPVNAINIDANTGAKVVLDSSCVGCGLCTIACPFGTIFYNPDTQKAFKCDLCGGNPACVTACPTDAIEYVDTGVADWLGGWAEHVNTGYIESIDEGEAV